MKNTKKEELKRSILLAGEGFCKKLSLKELYAENPVWEIVNRLGARLTKDWPSDKNGKKYWSNQTLLLHDVRYQCMRVIYSKSDEELKDILSDDIMSDLSVKMGLAPFLALKNLLIWVALKFVKNPSTNVRKYTRYLQNLFFSVSPRMIQYFIDKCGWDEYSCILRDSGSLLTPEEELGMSYAYEWIYKNMEFIEPQIRELKSAGSFLKIKPQLALPSKMYGRWWRQTNNFNIGRIGQLLTLWDNNSDRIRVIKNIKEDYESWQIDDKEERDIKLDFLNDLHNGVKNNGGIELLCRLEEINIQSKIEIKNLSDENERTKQYLSEERNLRKSQGKIISKDTYNNNHEEVEYFIEEKPILNQVNKKNKYSRKGGRKSESLFKDKNGQRDEKLTQKWANLFVEYMKLHKAFSKKIDSSKSNYTNRTFVVFYQKWVKSGIVSKTPNCNACYHFLHEDCRLQIKVGKNTYANHIRNMINEVDKASLLSIEMSVDAFLKEHNK